jgi:hypothetical protein
MKLCLLSITFISVALMSSCWPRMPAECTDTGFFGLPGAQQEGRFRGLPMEKQVELFICDYRYRHPFNIRFAVDIAERGDGAIPYLADKLKSEKDVNNQGAIIYILKIMFEDGHVRNKEVAAQVMRQVIPEMKCNASESLCDERRKEIERIIALGH